MLGTVAVDFGPAPSLDEVPCGTAGTSRAVLAAHGTEPVVRPGATGEGSSCLSKRGGSLKSIPWNRTSCGTIDSVESTSGSGSASEVALPTLFSDLVRLETDLWGRVDDRLRRDHDLPLSWFEPMQLMNRVPGCRVADIAAALSITVGGSSKLVDRIEQAGWCGRRPNPDDARSSVVHLTRAGRRLLENAQGSFEDELEVSLGAVLPPERLVSLAMNVRVARQRLADRHGSA